MTPDALSDLQTRAYRDMAPWSARDFVDLLAQPTTLLTTHPHAFCLGRIILDEGEILALATDPDHQRQGRAGAVLTAFEAQARARGVTTLHLEVAETNTAARAFYRAQGYAPTGLRKGYYRQPDGTRTDAVLMARAFTGG